MLNKVILIGRLGADAQLTYTQSGKPVTHFNLATDASYTSKDGQRVQNTEWHRIVMWDRMAENASKYLRKGSLVYIEGSLRTRKWQDKQGNDRYVTEIVAQTMRYLERRTVNEGYAQDQGERSENQGGYGQRYGGEQSYENHGAGYASPVQNADKSLYDNAAPEGQPASPSESSSRIDNVPF